MPCEPTFITVLRPGWFTTVQDLGRPGYQQVGVPVSGAMDRVALILANRLVGNRDDEAALEITLRGPELLIERDTAVALAGADLSAAIDGLEVPLWTELPVKAGSRLTFGARRTGGRVYLAVAGGIDVPSVLGSRATHVASRSGGWHGRALAAGDRLPGGAPSLRQAAGQSLPFPLRPRYGDRVVLRLLPGPQADLWHGGLPAALTRQDYRLSVHSNRMGYRLDGPPVPPPSTAPWISDATAAGALQIPPDGQPILLMADRQTTGGYPKPAAVISADLHLAGQLLPGDRLQFAETSLPEARSIFLKQWDAWNEALPARLTRPG
jgi:antagonist of KipI